MLIKLSNPTVIAPTRATDKAAGFDIYMPADGIAHPGYTVTVPLGFSTAIPEGFAAILLPRSSVGSQGLEIMNTVGLIDQDFRGEWQAKLQTKPGYKAIAWKAGERVVQFTLVPVWIGQPEIVTQLPETNRGTAGFGTTGA